MIAIGDDEINQTFKIENNENTFTFDSKPLYLYQRRIQSSKLLVYGAGGLAAEVLKNCLLAGISATVGLFSG
jgi:molybdopterin/thiamine biosynthesis adenylyltransferase